jgi:hypothetical protein
MTYTALSLALSNASSATFRVWGKGISDQLTAMGLTKTSDTGQIDWATVAVPGSSSTAAGYEIRKFTDSADSTAPIRFKIEYGSGASVAGNPGLWITVGSASDGAGTITNNTGDGSAVTTRRLILGNFSYTTAETGTVHCWVDPDGSAFGLLMWPSLHATTYAGGLIGVERWRDADGTANTLGWTFFGGYGNGVAYQSAKCKGTAIGQPAESATGWMCPAFNAYASTAVGSTLYPAPVFLGHQNRLFPPSKMLVVIGHADLSAGSTFAVSHYGSSRTFVSAGSGLNTGSGVGWGNTSLGTGTKGLAMRAD